MSKTISATTTPSPIANSSNNAKFYAHVQNYANWAITKQSENELQLVNVNSSQVAPESITFGHATLKDVYQGADILPEYRGITSAGSKTLVRWKTALRVSDDTDAVDDTYYVPVSMTLTITTGNEDLLSDADYLECVEHFLGFLVAGTANPSLGSVDAGPHQLKMLRRGALIPTNV